MIGRGLDRRVGLDIQIVPDAGGLSVLGSSTGVIGEAIISSLT